MAQFLDSAIFEIIKTWREQRFLVARRSVLWRLILAFTIGLTPHPTLATGGRAAGESQSPQYLPDRIIIKFATGTVSGPQRAAIQALAMPAPVAEILAGFGATETAQLFPARPQLAQKRWSRVDLSSIYEIRFSQAVDIKKMLSLLRQQADVVYAEPVYLRRFSYDPNDPARSNQSYLNTVKAREAWDVTRGDTSVVIAIVDTGVDWQHADLTANIWRNYKEIPNNGVDDDGNGYKDDVRGWDFGGANGTEDNDPREEAPTHGTLVAGIASAASDNGVGVSGLGFKCKIMPVKATNRDLLNSIPYGFKGIVYAAENGADIINCSWGSAGYSQIEQEAIDYATDLGALVVAAAGNEGSNCLFYPAAYHQVLSVAATDLSDRIASYSNYGFWVDLAAPGNSIYGTWQPSTYTSSSGTSFASPIVAGVAALVKSQNPGWAPGAIAEKVRLACDNISSQNPSLDRQIGNGRVNAQRAVLASNTPGVRIDSLWFQEVAGDNDGYFEINEEIAVSVRLKNFLQPANNLAVTLSENSAYISVSSGGPRLVNISNGGRATLTGAFRIRVAANAPTGEVAVLYFNFSVTGYDDWQGFAVSLGRFAGDLAAGNVATTVSSFGAIGFSDYASCGGAQLGRGFEFPLGAKSALYHGGFLIATAANRVSDVSYGSSSHDRYDFVTAAGGDLNIQPGSKATLELTSRFNDSAAESPLGLTVDQKVYAWANALWNDFVILEYTIRNTTTQAVNNVYAGVYLDWDIGDDSNANFANWDNANQLGYEWTNGSAYYGITAVSPAQAASYRAVKNPDYVWTGFTDTRKYQFMTEGFQVVSSNEASDWSQLLSSGPHNLAGGGTVVVAFAILGGTNLADLQANARASRNAYNSLSVGVDSPDNTPVQFELAQNAPNPFAIRAASATEIRYSLAESGPVTLRIFNLLGQEVAVLVQGVQNIGNYAVQWNGRDRRGLAAPSGVYFYQIKTSGFTATRKLILVE